MKDGCDRLVERAFQAWIVQRLYGLSGVGNVHGGVWVVLKLEWNPLHPRTPPAEPTGPSPALSAPSPSCPSSHGGPPNLVQPHLHLLILLSLCDSFFLGPDSGCFACFSFVFWVSCKL